MIHLSLLVALLLSPLAFAIGVTSTVAAATAASPASPTPETVAQRDARMAWWRKARFGMFIHWDPSSVAGTEISWSRRAAKPLDIGNDPAGAGVDPKYDTLYQKFNPVNYDPKQWVAIAQDAGMKYLVITCKHHGGFCMWDTKLTDYNITHTPYAKDVIKPLADACHEAGLKFGVYYSPRDWHHPDYGIGDNRKYVDYMNGQLRELLTQYGQVDEIWFDSYGQGDLVKFWHIDETWNLIKSLQPNAVVNNRLAVLAAYNRQPKPYVGDFDTPEQRLGEFQRSRPWESCISIVTAPGGGWSYRPDGHIKTARECIRDLASCASGDGNLLLDVGPNPQGEIPADQMACLKQIGQWMQEYGESIYGTRGGPYRNGAWGGSTYHDNTVYLHVFGWPQDGTLKLAKLKARVLECTALTGGTATVLPSGDSLSISLPQKNVDAVDTILRLKLDAPVENELDGDKPLPGADVPAR